MEDCELVLCRYGEKALALPVQLLGEIAKKGSLEAGEGLSSGVTLEKLAWSMTWSWERTCDWSWTSIWGFKDHE